MVLDRLTKALVVAQFSLGESLPLIPSVFHLTYVQNTGAAFGLLKGYSWLFIGLSIVVVVWIVWELFGKQPISRLLIWGGSLIIGGALGNLIDRLQWSYVVDFIDFRVWPVFNVADSAITLGVILLLMDQTRIFRHLRRVHRNSA